MSAVDWVILGLLGIWLFFALRSMTRHRGCGGCKGCSQCGGCENCGRRPK